MKAGSKRTQPPATRRWRRYQAAADRRFPELGLFVLLWRRQSGKTEVLSTWALEGILRTAGATVILASASLNVGGEVALRAAGVLWDVLGRLKSSALQTNAGEGFDALAEAFTAGKLEVRFEHPGGRVSRLKVIAPNPATARGFSGTVFLDEVGYIRDFRAVWDAVEPITSSDPTFRLIMSTTPPADAGHFSHELLVEPVGKDDHAQVAADGRWYRSEAGLWVHRVDAWDAAAAGARLYHPETRAPLSVDEHRSLAIDKEAWDRNYGLRFALTGTTACSLAVLHFAQTRPEAKECHAWDGDLPADWRQQVGPVDGPVALGYDVATTEGEASNPSALAVLERRGGQYLARMVFRWKSALPQVSRGIVREVASAFQVRRLVVDASSEKYYAQQVRQDLAGVCPVELVASSEVTTRGTSQMSMKVYLGNLLVGALEDAALALPGERWIRDDFRLVRRARGSFETDVDGSGRHGDTFDAVKMAMHGWASSGPGAFTAETVDAVTMGPAAGPAEWALPAGGWSLR